MLTSAYRFLRDRIHLQRPSNEATVEQRILVIHDPNDLHAAKAFENACMALRYARLRFDAWPVSSSFFLLDLRGYSTVLMCSEALDGLHGPSVERLHRYVAEGGGLAVVYRGWKDDLCDLFGIEESDEWPGFLSGEDDAGLEFITDLFPSFEGLCFAEDEINGHVPFDIVPTRDVQVIATNGNGRPLAWLNNVGAGRVVYWNTAVLAEKTARGLIVQSIGCVQKHAVLPIANIGLIHIDDFPPPPMDLLPEPIASEFPGLTPRDFYYRIWHEDMLLLAEHYGLAYSYFAVFDYAQTAPILQARREAVDTEISDAEAAPHFDWSAADKIGRSSELGLHGYNHVPLLLEHWGTLENMEKSLAGARTIWREWQAENLPTSYAPPCNEYDQAGARALSTHFPEIEAICSTYAHGVFERGGDREFGPEPWAGTLFAVPRATSGFQMDSENRFEMVSQLETMGVWTHFVHPDDAFDTPERCPEAEEWRNPQSRFWRGTNECGDAGLLSTFGDWLGFARKHFPWLRYLDNRSAVPLLKAYLGSAIEVRLGENGLSITAEPGCFFRVRSNIASKINPAGIVNAELVDVLERPEFAIYTFRATGPDVELELI